MSTPTYPCRLSCSLRGMLTVRFRVVVASPVLYAGRCPALGKPLRAPPSISLPKICLPQSVITSKGRNSTHSTLEKLLPPPSSSSKVCKNGVFSSQPQLGALGLTANQKFASKAADRGSIKQRIRINSYQTLMNLTASGCFRHVGEPAGRNLH